MIFVIPPSPAFQKAWVRRFFRGSWVKLEGHWRPVRVVRLGEGERGTYYLTSSGLINSMSNTIEAKEIR